MSLTHPGSGHSAPYAYRNRHAEGGHRVQGGDPRMDFRHLGRELPGGQTVPEELLEAVDSVLGQAPRW